MTELQLLTDILNRLDLMYTLMLYEFIIAVALGICYLLYRAIIHFF